MEHRHGKVIFFQNNRYFNASRDNALSPLIDQSACHINERVFDPVSVFSALSALYLRNRLIDQSLVFQIWKNRAYRFSQECLLKERYGSYRTRFMKAETVERWGFSVYMYDRFFQY